MWLLLQTLIVWSFFWLFFSNLYKQTLVRPGSTQEGLEFSWIVLEEEKVRLPIQWIAVVGLLGIIPYVGILCETLVIIWYLIQLHMGYNNKCKADSTVQHRYFMKPKSSKN